MNSSLTVTKTATFLFVGLVIMVLSFYVNSAIAAQPIVIGGSLPLTGEFAETGKLIEKGM